MKKPQKPNTTDYMTEAQIFCHKHITNNRVLFSPKDIKFQNKKQKETPMTNIGKPNGLWYSVGNEWLEWCIAEDFTDIIYNRKLYEITLNTNQMLFIKNAEEMRAFNKAFKMKEKNENKVFFHDRIDWLKVSKKYSGIEIAPYQYEFRLDNQFFW